MIRRMFKGTESHSASEELRRSVEFNENWPDAFKEYMSQPLADLDTPLNQLEYLAIDFETSGLNVQKDKILSIGMVEFTLDQIELSNSEEVLIDNGEYIKAESAKINGLTPQALANGVPLEQGMERLLERAKGRVILAHSCNIEKSFIEAFLEQYYQLDVFPAYFIDTIHIEKRFSYAGKTGTHKSYQLNDMRRHYKLPNYLEHSAGSDALSCAELFLVQYKKLKLGHIKGMTLKKIQS
ncbi:exonuclease domain-containing protein [Vibrio ziniensis]|uniref:DNA polymerase III subunit epsilon n=1 Tax=Vibrio ziniensis TaxID=2711221 RepID=A0A6G7CPU3_9VIBR|nr:exonuclease domain-containing protein [Vibrio ziniensis]QIH44110.1 DNA polymerase III subunit epsilon [Vibrio ziniensis]